MRARLAGLGDVMGRRYTGSSSPISPIAAFHRNGVGFHEVDVHERQVAGLYAARGLEIAAPASLREAASFRRESGSRPPR